MANAPAAKDNRPLSPHLQVYRPQITSVLSITHRFTGVALVAGLLLLTWWLAAAASGPEAFAVVQGFVGSWFGLILLFGWTWTFMYHFANGIRHLVWDTGYGLELPAVYTSGYVVVGASIGLTLLVWIIGLTVV